MNGSGCAGKQKRSGVFSAEPGNGKSGIANPVEKTPEPFFVLTPFKGGPARRIKRSGLGVALVAILP